MYFKIEGIILLSYFFWNYASYSSNALLNGLLQPLLVILEEVWMDFITGLPPSNSDTVVFVVVDRVSKI